MLGPLINDPVMDDYGQAPSGRGVVMSGDAVTSAAQHRRSVAFNAACRGRQTGEPVGDSSVNLLAS